MSIGTLLRTVGRGATKIPRIIGEAFYQERPSDPISSPIDPGGGYQTVDAQKTMHPVIRRILDSLPSILEAGVTAAATPTPRATPRKPPQPRDFNVVSPWTYPKKPPPEPPRRSIIPEIMAEIDLMRRVPGGSLADTSWLRGGPRR